MNHTEIINHIINKNKYKSYLEIGTRDGTNFEAIQIKFKECCDIDNSQYLVTYHMTSDEMFAQMPIDKKYDIIFIDGLHNELYVKRDIINSLKHLNKGGIICVHDVLPGHYTFTTDKYIGDYIGNKTWNGDVYKAIVSLQDLNIEFYTVINNDYGLTLIKYFNNPHQLTITNERTNILFDYIFNDNGNNIATLSNQGQYVMHVINENQIDQIL